MRHNPGKMKLEVQSVSSSKSSQLIFRFNLGRGINDQTSNNPEMVRVQPYVSHGYKIQVEYPKVRKTATPNPHAVSAFPQPRAKKAWPFSQSRSVCALSCLCTSLSRMRKSKSRLRGFFKQLNSDSIARIRQDQVHKHSNRSVSRPLLCALLLM